MFIALGDDGFFNGKLFVGSWGGALWPRLTRGPLEPIVRGGYYE